MTFCLCKHIMSIVHKKKTGNKSSNKLIIQQASKHHHPLRNESLERHDVHLSRHRLIDLESESCCHKC